GAARSRSCCRPAGWRNARRTDRPGRAGAAGSAVAAGRERHEERDAGGGTTDDADRLGVAVLGVVQEGLGLDLRAAGRLPAGLGGAVERRLEVGLRLLELDARVEARAQLVHRPGELLPGAGEVRLDLLRCALLLATHDLSPFFTASMSALRLAFASSAEGASPDCSSFLPTRAKIPAMTRRTTPMTMADSQAGSASASPRSAATANIAAPAPTFFAFSAALIWMSSSSPRRMRANWSEIRATSSPTVGRPGASSPTLGWGPAVLTRLPLLRAVAPSWCSCS